MKELFKSFSYALNGIAATFSEQRNMKIHLAVAIVVIGAGFYFRISNFEWLAITIVIGFVFTAELFNTSIEYIVNMISAEHRSSAGKIKDIAAGAVLVSAITSIVVGVLIFKNYIF